MCVKEPNNVFFLCCFLIRIWQNLVCCENHQHFDCLSRNFFLGWFCFSWVYLFFGLILYVFFVGYLLFLCRMYWIASFYIFIFSENLFFHMKLRIEWLDEKNIYLFWNLVLSFCSFYGFKTKVALNVLE